ncbi:hypothetical protein [Polluticaenibacter yanchengensis]|uniref:Uncharacterized protein n=1 Tax=Polluticaenibacter yanchengensis TaxID=3014562 RepID=A0ABT4UMI8_9BACT|nr:hypothetical protein [Chitinophagaceae bacterium LY-5]
MNTVQKFATFDELKSCETEKNNPLSRLKKHNDFKKIIAEIRDKKVEQDKQLQLMR